MELISVIIPIYNVEPYLHRALDSLLTQTYAGWEAILVDDGSPDACGAIADEYALRDSRFKVIHKVNEGVSKARNIAMIEARGKYLLFLDPDDFFHPQLMELCVGVAEKENADMVTFTYHHFYRTINKVLHSLHLPECKPYFKKYGNVKYVTTDNVFDYATEYSHPKDIDRKWAIKHCQPCFRMYRTDIVRNIPFIEGIRFEDFPWWSEVLLHVGRCSILNLPLYYYYPNPKSFLLSSNAEMQAYHLEQGIIASRKIYSNAPIEKKKLWEKQFLAPFMHYLEKKLRKIKS
ncbi:MAG: glycosyltransferase family 2 protein [Bacteroidaceae bacterium]|nr:glycosyltransferase family 2 protein [Bacteroidaceae bacterium]